MIDFFTNPSYETLFFILLFSAVLVALGGGNLLRLWHTRNDPGPLTNYHDDNDDNKHMFI